MREKNTLKIAEITCRDITRQVINGICYLWSGKAWNRNATKNQSHVVLIGAEIPSSSELSSEICLFFSVLRDIFWVQ